MNPYALCSLIYFVISLFTGTYILAKDPAERMHILFAGFAYAGALLCFSDFLTNTALQAQTALIYSKIGVLSYLFLPSLLCHFALIFGQKESLLKRKLLYLFLYLPIGKLYPSCCNR